MASAQSGVLFVKSRKVGIGVSDPTELLHLRSTTPGDTLLFIQNTSGPERVGSRYQNSLATWDFRIDGSGGFIFDNTATSGEDLKIQQDGTLRVGPAPAKIILKPNGDIDIQGTLTEGSSRDYKQDFESLSAQETLNKVMAMNVMEWSYKHQTARHIGPMAEDFHSLFGLGSNDKSLAPRDVAGVALLAIQGLRQELHERDEKIDRLQQELDDLRAMVEAQRSK